MARAIEVVGFLLIIAFCWFVWAPLVLLAAGLLMVAHAQSVNDKAPDDRGSP